MNRISRVDVNVNGRDYRWPSVPAVAICLDGCEPAYLDEAIKAGLMPALERILAKGTARTAHSVIPSFTNPNNLSIATGRPPAVHGICGNYLYEPETGREVMMNDARFLRAPTIFKAFFDAGAKVAVVTAKDKLRALLGHGLDFAGQGDLLLLGEIGPDDQGRKRHRKRLRLAGPSGAGGLFGRAFGVRLRRRRQAAQGVPAGRHVSDDDRLHPAQACAGRPGRQRLPRHVRPLSGELDALGAAIVITADHGMKPKHKADGTPDVVYVQDLLDDWLGKAAARVILPITDPYVVHHGALGSFATAYLPEGADRGDVMRGCGASRASTWC
jgi:phosphonoacetate hydrolase